MPEHAFAARIFGEMSEPATCVVGYNSLRFDDELTRHLFWRNFYDPYAREWQNGNSRFDLIDVMRAAFALRPEGLVWPRREDGAPSFRLDELAPANSIEHSHAHTALADVQATLALARKLKRAQPKLLEHALGLRDKQRVLTLLDWQKRTPLVHISQRFPASRGCLAIVVPLAFHPTQAGKVIVYDSHQDPTALLSESPERLAEMLVQSGDDGARTPVGLKLVHSNKVPFLAPLSVLKGIDTERIALDSERCQAHIRSVQSSHGLDRKAQAVFAALDASRSFDDNDVDSALYDGFIGDNDRKLSMRSRASPADQLAEMAARFHDQRLRDLGFRYRARHFPDTLSAVERSLWLAFVRRRLDDGPRTAAQVRERALAVDDAIGNEVLAWLDRVARFHAQASIG